MLGFSYRSNINIKRSMFKNKGWYEFKYNLKTDVYICSHLSFVHRTLKRSQFCQKHQRCVVVFQLHNLLLHTKKLLITVLAVWLETSTSTADLTTSGSLKVFHPFIKLVEDSFKSWLKYIFIYLVFNCNWDEGEPVSKRIYIVFSWPLVLRFIILVVILSLFHVNLCTFRLPSCLCPLLYVFRCVSPLSLFSVPIFSSLCVSFHVSHLCLR